MAAICCGNKIIAATTTTAAQSKTLPIQRPRRAHCLARCCCQNPRAIKRTDKPSSQGRSVVKNALASPIPKAPANPRGKQQLIVAMALRIAATDADVPVPCFTFAPSTLRGELTQQVELRFDLSRDTGDNSARMPVTPLVQHLVH